MCSTIIDIYTAPHVLLRPAVIGDARLLGKIHAASWKFAYKGILPDIYLENEIDNDRAAHWELKMSKLQQEKRMAMIAEIKEPNGEHVTIGFVCAEWPKDSPWGALLDNLHVLPEYQGLGVGKLMMQAVIQWAKQQGVSQLYLYVLKDNNKAIRIYERYGWQFSGQEIHNLGGKDLNCLRYFYYLQKPNGVL
ncbi:hypothetical protein EC973_004665 [Apophysomyces ossiformis]|uniref:N-acetyltransferase domain-containing protein n=1 Tax=Apophysomyces ossiformis TaxID=679940 RepID=A0A8H7BL28_9FUNG|nr:hypothetical protein EC973_004665 [Apophysomyces ossiformis]